MKIVISEPFYNLLNCKNIVPKLKYEKFLLEVLNHSKYFLIKSQGEKYKEPISESNSENDANTFTYQIDFKLLVNQELMHSKAINKPNIDYSKLEKGIIIVKDNEKIRNYSHNNILSRLMSFDVSENNSDIDKLLANIKLNKNLFFFFPYELKSNTEISIYQLERIFNVSLTRLLLYRTNNCPNFETYICTNLNDSFIIFEWNGEKLIYVESVSEIWCPLYRNLKTLALY